MAYRSSSSNNDNTTSTPTVTVPAGVQAGDIVVLACGYDSPSVTFTGNWPAGFTQATDTSISGPDGQRFGVAWKRLTGADTGSYTLTSVGSTGTWSIAAIAHSGRSSTSDPVASTVAVNTTGNSSPLTITANGVTAVAADDLLFIVALDVTSSGSAASITPPTGYTERVEVATPVWSPLELATLDNVSAGATGSVTASATLAAGTAGYGTVLIRIPVPGGGGGGATVKNLAALGVG